MTSHSRCAKDSASCDTKFCLLRKHRLLAYVLLKNSPGLVAWPLNESEAGGELALIETSLLFLC